mgnify:FL=1
MGISATVGSIATSVYYLYGNLTIADVLPDDKDRLKDALGDLGDYSAEDVIALFSKALKAPQNYTIADLEREYGFNLVDLINQAAGSDVIDTKNPDNKPYVDDLKSVSLFALLSGKVNVAEFLSDIPLGAVMSFVPSDTVLDNEQREKLRKYSIGSLAAKDETTGTPVAVSALSELTIGGILPGIFEKSGDKYIVKDGKPDALGLIANLKLGGFVSPLTGATTIGDELVSGGLSALGELSLGEIYRTVGVNDENDVAGTLDGLFTDSEGNPIKLRDLFAKDISSGNDSYVFVVDKLLDSIRFGTLFGMTRKDGEWVVKKDDGTEEKATGLLKFLANLNLTDVYHALTDAATTKDRIHKIILIFGDLSVGDVFETLGYSKDEDGRWVKPDGSRLKSRVAEALLDFSIRDIVGEASSELSFDQIRKNIVGAISGLCDDMTIGEGFGELFGVAAANGKYYDPETGNPVNEAIARILDIKIRDITDCFAKDKIDVDEIYGVFEKAIAGVYVGAILGAERIDGEWYANGGKVTDVLAMLYNVRLEGLFSVIKELQNPDGFSYSEIIKGFLPEACVGDILCAFSGMTRHNVGDSAYFTDANGSPVGEGLNKLLRLRLWQIAAGFDKNGNFDLKAVLDEIKVGDALDAVYDADKNEWTLLDRTAKGGLAEIMNVSLGLLVSGDTEKINDTLTGDAKNVSLGDVLTFALAYKDGKILNSDAELNEFAQKFIEWNAPTVNYVEDLVKNKDFEKLRNDINAQFGALKIGEAFRPYLVSRNDEGKYVFSALEQISGIVEPIFNTDFKIVVDIIFDLIAGKSVDFGKILTDIYGSLTIGEVIAPIVGLSLTDGTAQVEAGKKVYVTNNGNGTSLGLGVTALMKTSIFGLVQSVIDGVNNKDGKNLVHRLFGTTEEKGAIDIDHVLGEYVYSFLKLDYDGKDWTNGDGKTYAPITTLLNANLYEIIDHVLDINKAYTADEKKDYFIGILDDLTIKDILSFSKGITESDKALVQKVGDVKLVRFVVDLIEKNDRIAVIKESGFGKVAIGDLVQLAVDIKQDATGWKKSGGEYFACMISDAFSLDVNKIFEITDDIKAGGDNVVTEVFNKVFPERRVGDFVNVLIPSLSDDCTRGNYKTWGTNKAAGDLPLVLSDVFNLKFKTFFDALLGEKKSAVDIVLTITDEIFGDPVNNHPEHASWARSFNDYMKDFGLTYLDEHKAFDDIKDVKVGEFIYHVLKDKDPAAYLEGLVNNISLGDIAELPLGEEGVQKLPLIARDLCDVLVGDIIQIVKGGEDLKANICATIDKVTKNDAEGHRFGDYLDDLLKGKASESIIKTNEGLKGITDIKISELVKVILKQTTVEMKTDGTLAKMGVSDKLPEGLKNIIIYICDNITDNALIGDFLINGANGYRKEANGDGYIWYDNNGKACEDILNTVYSLETSYVLYLIGGIYIVATEPDTVMQEVLKLKAGTIVMPIYNLMLEKAGEYASKMTCSDTKEESEKVYEIKGLYKDLLTKLSNMTLGEIKDEVQTRPMWIAEYFYNRELGDLLYDALSMTVGKTLGIEGFAYEHKGPDGYTTDNKVLTAVFNFNVKSMLDATDKAEYILGIFGEVRVGDIVNLVSSKIAYDANIELWVNGTQTAKYIVNDLFNITANNVTEWVKTIKAGIVEDVIRLIVADVTVNRTLDDYLSDIGNATVDRIIANGAFDKIAREETLIQVTDVVLNNLKNKKYVDLITYYFGDIRVGDVANIVNGNIKYDANIGLWVNGTQTAKYIVSDLFDIGVNAVKEVAEVAKNGGSAEKVVKKAAEKLFKTRTLEDYLLDINNANVTKVVEKAIFDQLMRKESVVQIINYVLDRIYYKDYAGIAEHYLGEASLGDIAELPLGEEGVQKLPLIARDLCDVLVGDIIQIVKGGEDLKANICATIDKVTKNDAEGHRFGDYLDDLLKGKASESIIKTNEGLKGITDIKISELVKVILKQTTVEMKTDGTLAKMGVSDKLPEGLKNIIIYICDNITDNALIGDFLINGANGYRKEANGDGYIWYDNNGKACEDILNTVYSLETSYVLYLIGGIYIVATEPDTVMQEVLKLKAGTIVMPIYNLMLEKAGEYASKMTCSDTKEESEKVYEIKGLYKDLLTKLSNMTLGEIKDEVQTRPMWIAEYFYNRELGDLLYDALSMTVGKTLGIEGFAYEHKGPDGYTTDNKVLTAVFNFNVKSMLDATDKAEYILGIFGEVRVGDIVNLVSSKIAYDANIELWVNGTQTAKYIVNDLFNITANNVTEWVKTIKAGIVEDVIRLIVADVTVNRTLDDYLSDIGNATVDRIIANGAFDKIAREETLIQVTDVVLNNLKNKKYVDLITYYFGDIRVGAVAEFVNGIEAPAAEGEKWTYKNGGIPYVLGDAMDLTFADVIGMFAAKSGETLPTWQNRIATLVAKYTKNDLRTLKTYIEDLAGKSLNVKGLADLSDIRIAELVSVALKVNAEEIKADEGGTLDKLGATNDLSASVKNLVIYVCNITDKVLLGDYLTQLDNPEGGVHRDADGKWFNKTTEVTGLLKTIYGLPTTYLFGAVVAVVKPQLVIDAVGGYKIGKLIKNPYNNALRSLESSIGETNGEYYAEGSFKAVVDTFVNLTVNDILADIKAGTFVDGLEAKFVLDRKLGDYLFDLISILAKKTNKSGYGIKGYAYESVNAEGLYETSGNFKKIYDIVLNIKFKEDLFDQKSNVLVHLKEMFQTLYLGDLFYDVLRSVSKSKLCEGYGFENFEENIGYKLDKQFADVLGAVFNVQLLDINNCIGKDFTARFKNLLKVKFGELTVGDFGYDLFAKYLATKLSLKANGYAYEFKADNTMLKGKAAKVVAATFNISLNDIDAFMKNYSAASGKAKNTAIINFVIDTYGTLTVGDVLGAIVEKLTATKLQMTYTYDEDYNLTVTGNFKEIANVIFSSSSGDLLRAIRANNVKAYFLGDQKGTTDGLVGGLNLGDVLGYAFKAKAFKGFVKNTDIERNETTGKWEIARSFSHPLSILCNDVTISGLLRKINEPKQFIINTLGDVCVGEMLGKYLVDDVWYKADGTVEDVSAENGGVIMKHVYGIKLGELLGEGFNINKILGDVYVGELIGYAHCGKKYTKTEGEHTQYNVCTEETHTDNADGYHIHADECTLGHSETSHEAGWYKKNGTIYEEVGVVEGVMADIRLGYILGNGDVKFGDMFGSLKLGDVLGYEYCDNAAGGKCTVTAHTTATHDKIKTLTWYVKESAGYRMANAIERTLANVPMKDILNGTFNVDDTLNTLKLGNLMNYEYCDGVGDACMIGHDDHTAGWYKNTAAGWEMISHELYCDGEGKHCGVATHDHTTPPTTGYAAGWYHYDAKSGKWVINEDGKNTGNNILLCMIGRSVNDSRGSNFTTELVNDINNYVLIGDIYDMTAVTGPINLISPNTKLGDISHAMAGVMSKATAKELNENGLLPVSATTTDRMSEVYGAVIFVSANLNPVDWTYTWKDPETDPDAIVPKSGTTDQAEKAIDGNKALKPTATPGTTEYDEQLKAYEKAIGKIYWESLTIDQLVDVLLLSARV